MITGFLKVNANIRLDTTSNEKAPLSLSVSPLKSTIISQLLYSLTMEFFNIKLFKPTFIISTEVR